MGDGIFAAWQPEYAKYGVPTFPLAEGKKPAIRGYLRIGSKASERLVSQFSSAMGLGLPLGLRTGISVLDIDSSNENLLKDCLRKYGPTPVVIRTGGGNFHAWYKHNGEQRLIRPNPDLPIDILGGGFTVGPPSQVENGRYFFVEGSLADLPRLPVMKEVPPLFRPYAGAGFSQVPLGRRNDSLFRYALRQAPYVDDEGTLLDVVKTENESACSAQLGDEEIVRLVRSAWSYQVRGRNLVGRKYVPATYSEIDCLVFDSPDALALLMLLRRRHLGRTKFALAKAFASTLGWSLPRYRNARRILEERGYIQCLHRGGFGKEDPPVYRLSGTDSRLNKLTDTALSSPGTQPL